MSPAMSQKRNPVPRAGGVLLAGAILGGAIAGVIAQQPSLGFLAGLAVGLVLLGIVWLRDRR